jgi:hypothetical protein
MGCSRAARGGVATITEGEMGKDLRGLSLNSDFEKAGLHFSAVSAPALCREIIGSFDSTAGVHPTLNYLTLSLGNNSRIVIHLSVIVMRVNFSSNVKQVYGVVSDRYWCLSPIFVAHER